ncbi:MAG: hypothetical protein CMJ48_10470 [Planctomycetaceae bacterium]|nr:hypothetical protein [Planctomycetaceae bacterium]
MSTAASGLKDLHLLHLQSQTAAQKLDHGPRQIKARQQFTAGKLAEVASSKGTLIELKKISDSKTLQLKINEDKIADLKGKLNAAASNREYDIIRGQIDADTMANSVLEDEILGALDNVDRLQTQIEELEKACETAKAEELRVAEEFNATVPGLNKEIEHLGESINSLERMLPAKASEAYRRLVKSYGPDAMAPLEDSACSSCFVQLSPQVRVEVNSGKIVFCNQCGRLLYRNDD